MTEVNQRGRRLGTFLLGTVTGIAATTAALSTFGYIVPRTLAGPAFHKFESAYEALYTNYYRPVAAATLLNGAINGMTNALGDPFSDYFPPIGETQLQNALSNAYVGIGAVVQEVNGDLTIQSVIPKSPAAKAGLKANDFITAINQQSTHAMSADQAANLIIGPAGQAVRLTVQRPAEPGRLLHFTLKRARITAPEVYPRMLPHHIGYLRLSIVGANASAEVQQALGGLKHQGATGLILDVRGNPGGYLDQALAIANQLIPKGKIVVQVQNRTGPAVKSLSQGPGLRMPIVVLMDRDTASAAEILSAALHDDVGAPLVGTRSYGKGTAQTSDTYPDGSGLKYTVAKWLTPTGQWINHVGIQPTERVNLPTFASLTPLDSTMLPLRLNQVSTGVATLQKTLTALGFHVDRTDGYFDASTQSAVERFQARYRLPVTGSVGTASAQQLNIGLANAIASSDTQLTAAEQLLLTLHH